jgi:hypothetical protein
MALSLHTMLCDLASGIGLIVAGCSLCATGCDAGQPAGEPKQPQASVAAPTPPVVSLPSPNRGAGPQAEARAATGQIKQVPSPAVEKRVKPVKPGSAKLGSAPREPASAQPTGTDEPPKMPEPEPSPTAKGVVPRTQHVHAEVPKGLQAWLDADSRMQPWVAQVMRVADTCYARVRDSVPNASGVIEVAVTMHKDARPDPDILALPPQLSGIVACATGDLIRSGMPLFTGSEGERYTVRVVFEP